MNRTIQWVVLLAFGLPAPATADRGFIPHKPHVRIFEPNQRAMIAWNGEEQILVLTTDLRASEATTVLEILPCPSEPKVDKGSLETFKRATEIINRYQKQRAVTRGRSKKRNGGGKKGPAGEITFHKKIGAHDIAVVHVLSADGFIEWVQEALKKAGVKSPRVPVWAREAVHDYIQGGFDWFVFDSIDLGPGLKTAQPIRYRFKTDRLFYPLRITKVEGPTTVDLVVLSPELLSKFPGLPGERIELPHPPFAIRDNELEYIDKEMADLLGHRPSMKLRIWKIRDRGRGFTRDLIAH